MGHIFSWLFLCKIRLSSFLSGMILLVFIPVNRLGVSFYSRRNLPSNTGCSMVLMVVIVGIFFSLYVGLFLLGSGLVAVLFDNLRD